jgi:glyoxylase-like metal-dependent hydrolase (beta-lactamase superfamily II)
MTEEMEWFEVFKHKPYLYVIRERLNKLEPRFFTNYVNLFLILGDDKALLIDTGTGLFPLKPLIESLIENRVLIVINTHGHFDHRGGNEEFETIFAHPLEIKQLSEPYDLSFFKDSSHSLIDNYIKKNYVLLPANDIKSIEDGNHIDLGSIDIEIIHTPGHSSGSISLLSNRNEFFTGDTAHYGTMYLPERDKFPILISSLRKMLDICMKHGDIELYPSHETFPVGKELFESLINGISNLDAIWHNKIKDEFLEGWILEDSKFRYVIE